MSTYTIGEAARRSGFSASALRFYEDIGLVDPPGRTPSGYRLYDDTALARLAFVARAKQLGCSLEEITDLADIWDGQRCGPVQRRFHDLITAKLQDAETQAAELSAFTGQLRVAADLLSSEPIDGPCGPDCACLTSDTEVAPVDTSMVALARPPDTVSMEVPIACTLEPGRCRTVSPTGPASWPTPRDGSRWTGVYGSSSVPTSTSVYSAG